MASYSYGELEQLWISAGGPKALAPLMAAIALAESGGNPAANNYTDNGGTQTSWGLWQVSNGTHSWPGPSDPNVPMNNAKYAVAKYNSQGLTAWGTYDSGAYKQYYQGNVPPGSLPPGGTDKVVGGGSTSTATDLSFWDTNPLALPGELLQKAVGDLWGNVRNIKSSADAFGQIAAGFTVILHAFEWLFVPSHWIRIFAFGGGVLFLIPGLYSLMKTGQGSYGDVTLALGILLVMISGILFFIAFHNLPTDVTNLGELIGWMTRNIRKESSGTPQTAPA